MNISSGKRELATQSESQTRGHFPTAATHYEAAAGGLSRHTPFITVRLLAIVGVPAHWSLAEPHDARVTLAYVPCVTHSC